MHLIDSKKGIIKCIACQGEVLYLQVALILSEDAMRKKTWMAGVAMLTTALALPLHARAEQTSQDRSILSPVKDMLIGGTKSIRADYYFDRAKKGNKDAIKKLKEIAKLGNHEAQNYVGVIHEQGLFGERQDYSIAYQNFSAAYRNHYVAAYNLGIMTLLGRGTQKNQRAAMELFQESSRKLVIPQAALRIGHFYYLQGESKLAQEWLEKAREAGDIVAHYYLARLYLEDDKLRDATKARKYTEKASSARYLDAIKLNAYLHEQGIGGKVDLAQAATWKVIAHAIENRIAPDDLSDLQIDLYNLGEDKTKMVRRAARQWLERNSRDLDVSIYTKTYAKFDKLRRAD